MLACRADMARFSGAASYASLKATDATLAGAPGAAAAFLGQLADGVRPMADAEAAALGRLKAGDARVGGS
jgi:Zn-dependent oligopeptidase